MAQDFAALRELLRQAIETASDLTRVASREEKLVGQTLKSVDKAKSHLALQEMAKLPTEKLREASDSGIRVETLKRYGLTNLAAIYHAPISQLAGINGISDSAAAKIKRISQEIYLAISASISPAISTEALTSDDIEIITSLQSLQRVREATRGRSTQMAPIAAELQAEIEKATPVTSRLRWIFTGKERRALALESMTKLQELIERPQVIEIAESAKSALAISEKAPAKPTASEDFAKRSSDYFALLEDVTDSQPQSATNRLLNQDLLDQIESTNFDTSLINATLRKYQLFGSKFALTQNRVIIGDEMGLGKTIQAIGVLAQRKSEGATHFLVIAPASVLINWVREIEDRSDLTVIKIHASDRELALSQWRSAGGVALTTFDTLKSFGLSRDEITLFEIDTVIVDEAHYIKNPSSGRAKAVSQWLERTPRAIFLTGTPLENRVEEFNNLARLLDPGVAETIDRTALAAGPLAFRQAVAPIYLRRNTEEVLKELPELIEVTDYCTWDGVDIDYYNTNVIQGNFMGMRRAGYLAKPGEVTSKMERLLELVSESMEGGQKVLIFSFFTSVIEEVMKQLGDIAMGPITGATSPTQRQQIVDDFNNSIEPRVLVGQIQAAGTGLNIQSASVVILCEPQIKPSLEVQAIARAHRMGQLRKVQVHRLIIPESVDDAMLELLLRKRADFDAYARESALADSADGAKDLDEESMAKVVILKERERLTLKQ